MRKLIFITGILLIVFVSFGIANIRNTNKATAAAERATTAANAAQEEIKNLEKEVQNLADEKKQANAVLSEIVKTYNGSQDDDRATIENLKKRLKETPVITQPPPSIATAPHAAPTPRIETGNGAGGLIQICDSLIITYENALSSCDNTVKASLQTNAVLNALFDEQRLQTEQANARILANINDIRRANADEQRHNQRKAKRKRIVQTITATVTGIAAGVLINASL